jgi:hypothetical protein
MRRRPREEAVPRKQIQVRIHNRRWAVVHQDSLASIHDRKEDAVRAAHEIAAVEDAELVVFNLDEKPQQGGNAVAD